MPEVKKYTDYYPFGSLMPGRNTNADQYRFGFNGKENDSEIKGEGNSIDFGARIYDSRLGRWLSLDPLAVTYSSLSPYCFVGNSPVFKKDLDGEKIYIYYDSGKKDSEGNTIYDMYQYKSGLKHPKDKFVRETVRTLNRIQRRGKDPLRIINYVAGSNDANVAIVSTAKWNETVSNVLISGALAEKDNTLVPTSDLGNTDMIHWNTKSGYISEDGNITQSPANGLLHEIAHTYYQVVDPEGKVAEFNKALANPDDTEILEYSKKEKEDVGSCDTYEEKWIIEKVEGNFEEDKRNTHKGNYLHTKGGVFSRRGSEYSTVNGEVGKVKDLKK